MSKAVAIDTVLVAATAGSDDDDDSWMMVVSIDFWSNELSDKRFIIRLHFFLLCIICRNG